MKGVLVTQGQPNWSTFFCLCYFYVFSNYDDMDISIWIFFISPHWLFKQGVFNIILDPWWRTYKFVKRFSLSFQRIFSFLSVLLCCQDEKDINSLWKPALVAENINVSLRKQSETETFKENKTNIHILINLMLDFQSFNSGHDLTPLTKSIWKTLSEGNFI